VAGKGCAAPRPPLSRRTPSPAIASERKGANLAAAVPLPQREVGGKEGGQVLKGLRVLRGRLHRRARALPLPRRSGERWPARISARPKYGLDGVGVDLAPSSKVPVAALSQAAGTRGCAWPATAAGCGDGVPHSGPSGHLSPNARLGERKGASFCEGVCFREGVSIGERAPFVSPRDWASQGWGRGTAAAWLRRPFAGAHP
jgi:hypothetical protein